MYTLRALRANVYTLRPLRVYSRSGTSVNVTAIVASHAQICLASLSNSLGRSQLVDRTYMPRETQYTLEYVVAVTTNRSVMLLRYRVYADLTIRKKNNSSLDHTVWLHSITYIKFIYC